MNNLQGKKIGVNKFTHLDIIKNAQVPSGIFKCIYLNYFYGKNIFFMKFY